MDGLDHVTVERASVVADSHEAARQCTLKAPIQCVGIGLHSGRRVSLSLLPAAPGSGIVFRRVDLGIDIPARFEHVVDTRLCTVLGNPGDPSVRVGTVEHVLAALSGSGVTNAVIAVDGPETPILDGSAAGFAFLIDCAGLLPQEPAAAIIQVLRRVRVQEGAAYAELRPCLGREARGLHATLSIDFEAAAIGTQALSLLVTPESFRAALASARTFTQRHEIDALHQAGMALGGSLDNAVVVDGAQVLNPDGLRMKDEFVRHKLLDVVGDLALAGGSLHARFVAHRTGHALNNRLLRALFADRANWRLEDDTSGESRAGEVMALPPITRPVGRSGWHMGRAPLAAAPS